MPKNFMGDTNHHLTDTEAISRNDASVGDTIQNSSAPQDNRFTTANMGRRSFIRRALAGIAGGTTTALMGGGSGFSFLMSDRPEQAPVTPTLAEMNTGSATERPFPQELQIIPETYFQPADQQGMLTDLY